MFIDCVALCDFEIPFDHLTSRTLTWVFYFNNTFWILLFVSYNLMVTFFGGENDFGAHISQVHFWQMVGKIIMSLLLMLFWLEW